MKPYTDTYKINSDQIYSTQEVADMLRVKLWTVKKIIHNSELKSKKMGMGYKIYGRHIIEFIEREFI